MGKLLEKDKLDLNAYWYFHDARFNGSSGRYIYSWPNASFPYQLYIHDDELINPLYIEIRRWVEQLASDTVIVSHIEQNYRVYYDDDDKSWDKSYEVRNSWTCFNFETQETATLFKLRFLDKVRPITQWHPREPGHEKLFDWNKDEKISND